MKTTMYEVRQPNRFGSGGQVDSVWAVAKTAFHEAQVLANQTNDEVEVWAVETSVKETKYQTFRKQGK